MKTIEHALWAVALVICVTLVVFRPQPPPAPVALPVNAQNGAQTAARTAQGIVDAVRAIEAAKAAPAAFSAGVAAPVWNTLAAAGRTPTVTVYTAQYRPLSPAPVPSLAPSSGLPPNFAAWHHADTLAATEEALAKTPVDLIPHEVEIAPNRIGAVYVHDGSAGVVYAVARRKQLDLDLGIARGSNGLQLLAGYGWNLKHTDAGVFVGVGVERAPGNRASAGLRAGLVVHP